jgi:hypothetical protein
MSQLLAINLFLKLKTSIILSFKKWRLLPAEGTLLSSHKKFQVKTFLVKKLYLI